MIEGCVMIHRKNIGYIKITFRIYFIVDFISYSKLASLVIWIWVGILILC